MFRVVHDGKVVVEIEDQVISAVLRTSRGSGKPVFVGMDDGVIELVTETAPRGGPRRLDQLEAAKLQELRDRATEGELVGTQRSDLRDAAAKILRTPQGEHTDTLGQGEGRNTHPNLGGFPGKDLSKGAKNAEERTAAIEAFDRGDSYEDTDTETSDDGITV